MKLKNEISPKIISVVFGVFICLFALGFYVVAWEEPSSAPPGGNVYAPLNTGDSYQYKTGRLGVNTVDTDTGYGFIVEQSSVAGGKSIKATGDSWFDGDISATGQVCDSTGCIGALGGSPWTQSGSNIYYNVGNVGIGTASPEVKFEVRDGTVRVAPGTLSLYSYTEGIRINDAANDYAVLHLGGSAVSGTDWDQWTLLKNPNNDFELRNQNSLMMTVLDTTGNVGIGTASPTSGYKLDVTGPTLIDANDNAYTGGLGLDRSYPVHGSLWVDADGGSLFSYMGYYGHKWETSGGEKMRITSAGNVGIGDTTPDSKLDVEGGDIRISTAGTGLYFPDGTKQTTAATGVNLQGWSFANDYFYDDGENVIQASDEWLRLNQANNFSSGVYTPGIFRADGGLYVSDDERIYTCGEDYVCTDDNFMVTGGGWLRVDGTEGLYFQTYGGGWRMTDSTYIRSYGSKQVYLDNYLYAPRMYDTNDTGYYLDPNSTSRLYRIDANYFYYASDESLKANIKPIVNGLEKILKLEGVSFDWKDTGKASIGLISQDVEKIFPEIISTDEEGLKSIEYAKLIAPLIEAMKEQQKEIEQLRIEIEELKK
ncbi:tail fiber domain-containing protein [Patescibacteria group bacterium]|nr:tail fiber domain-containing protein [Patescibacteria group bacterium]